MVISIPLHFAMTPLQLAKERLTIVDLWAHYGYEGKPGRSCRSPFRAERKPSFSVYDDDRRWKDFGSGDGGDQVDFVLFAEGLADKSAAARRLIEIAGTGGAAGEGARFRREVQKSSSRSTEDSCAALSLPDLRQGSEDELRGLCRVRCFPTTAVAGLRLLQARGLLHFFDDPGQGVCWLITDAHRLNAQMRRLDGQPIPTAGGNLVKAKTLRGSRASWPIGLSDVYDRDHLLIIEGGPDLLAAAALVVEMAGVTQAPRFGFLCITGASNRLPENALEDLAGKKFTAVQHRDRAGRKATLRWNAQLSGTLGGPVDYWTLRIPASFAFSDGEPVGDLADFLAAYGTGEAWPEFCKWVGR